MIIKDILEEKMKDFCKDKTAVIYKGSELSYKYIYRRVTDYANRVEKFCPRGNGIGIFLPNSLDYIIAYFTVSFMERTIVPIDIQSSEEEIINLIEYCRLDMIMTNYQLAIILKKYLRKCKSHLVVCCIDSGDYFQSGNVFGISRSNEFNDVAVLLQTAGKSKSSKGVMLTHHNLINGARAAIESLNLNESDRTLISQPLTDVSAHVSQFLAHFMLGAPVILMGSLFIPYNLYYLTNRYKVTNFSCTSSVIPRLLDKSSRFDFNNTCLRFVCYGGDTAPIEKIKEAIEYFHEVDFMHVYYKTECATAISQLLPQYNRQKTGSVGKPTPNVQVRIIDDCGNDVKSNETGEIIIKSKSVMKGYYRSFEETSKTVRDGWLYTGDLGRYDTDGFLYIDKKKDSCSQVSTDDLAIGKSKVG